jgi:asparagine synthase (glutamine-hydrolysing)
VCGFVGVLHLNKMPVSSDQISTMSDMIRHRGPDDNGLFLDHNLGLGFRRLSIIDLESGHQPMSTIDGRFTIIYNGEIYNYIELRRALTELGYHFKTHSDTEVLLTAFVHYGKECLSYLNGMFSFAIWDREKRELFIGRDRLGIKPFYYYYDNVRFVFASEIKAIISDRSIPREPNYEAIADYLSYSYVSDHKTFFKNIYKLMPGHCGAISEQSGLHIEEYWDLDFNEQILKTEQEIADELKFFLSDAVNIHLRSDVKVGCHLSGGLDSSTVTCLAARKSNQQIKTFSGKFAEDKFYDETKYAKMVAAAAGTEYLEIIPSIEFFIENLHKIVWHMDEPVVGPGIIPQFSVCQLASQHVKVVLGGQGGDEIFGGYPRYFLAYDVAMKLHDTNKKNGQGVPIKKNIINILNYKINFVKNYAKKHGIAYTIRKIFRKIQQDTVKVKSFEEAWQSYCTSMDLSHPVISNSFRSRLGTYDPAETFLRYIRKGKSADILNQMLYHDTKAYLPGLLQVEDRTSMAVSIESRVPILDYRVVELAAKIPTEIKLQGLEPKYIFKKAMKGIIPDAILQRKDKKGFPTPIQMWFKEKPQFLRSILMDQSASSRGLFDQKEIEKLLESRDDNSWMIWSLLNVELWFKIFIDEDPRFVAKDGRPREKVEY